MKKILIISSSYFPINGGQEVGLKRIINGIAKFGKDYNISVLTPRYYRYHLLHEIIDGVDVFRYNSCLVKYPSKLFPDTFNLVIHMIYGLIFVNHYLRRIKPDFVILYFLTPTAPPTVYYLKKYHIPYLLFVGGNDIYNTSYFINMSNDYVFKNSFRIAVSCNHVRQHIIGKYKISNKNVVIIPYGINLNEYSPIIKSFNAPIRILCVQRLVKSKGTKYLILAINNLVRDGISNFFVDIVGDGYEKEMLQNLVSDLNLGGLIRFHGEIKNENIRSYYENSDVFVFPTTAEGFGIVLLEAMATNHIIIASNCTTIPDIIKNGYNGILFESQSVADLTKKLKMVMIDIKSYLYLATNATRDVLQYDISIVGRQFYNIIESEIKQQYEQ